MTYKIYIYIFYNHLQIKINFDLISLQFNLHITVC